MEIQTNCFWFHLSPYNFFLLQYEKNAKTTVKTNTALNASFFKINVDES